MGVLDNIKDKIKQIFNFNKSTADFLQYIHVGSCKNPCIDCPKRNLKIYKNGEEVFLPAHLIVNIKTLKQNLLEVYQTKDFKHRMST